jgi:hypothetical protein
MTAGDTTSRVLRIAGRIAAVVGVLAVTSYVSAVAHAKPTITFDDCSSGSPPPSTDPGLTPSPSSPGDVPPANDRTPPPDCTPLSGETVWGTRTIRFTVKATAFQERLKTVKLYILADDPALPDAANNESPVLSEAYANSPPTQKTYSVEWETRQLTPYNGRYKLHVESTTTSPTGASSATADRKDLRVDNEPAALAAVNILATTQTSISVRWDQAMEPDVLSYTLYRAVTSDPGARPSYTDLRPVATTQTTSFRDDDVHPASYWYSVKVTRRSFVTPQTGISSAFSPMSSAAVVKPTPAPVTNTSGGSPSSAASAATAHSLSRFVPLNRLSAPLPGGGSASVPDAPYSAYLPYDKPDAQGAAGGLGGTTQEAGADPRGVVLPVAVGAFLVSSALVLGRMPF